MPKIDRVHKSYPIHSKFEEETHLREIFYGTLIFQRSSMICIGHHVGGHALALQHGGQNYFLLVIMLLCKDFENLMLNQLDVTSVEETIVKLAPLCILAFSLHLLFSFLSLF